jgi:cellulose synthase/poly-beta-1,6-N-acetylglucosamine synthase-like glycosyltransferase
VWSNSLVRLAGGWAGDAVLLYSLLIVGHYLVLAIAAFLEARITLHQQRLSDRLSLFEGDLAPPVSVLVPAYNEELTIVDSVRSLMQLQYPSFEIIIVNDGSTDGTLEQLRQAFGLRRSYRTIRARVPRERLHGVYSSPDYPFLVVLDVVNGRKAMALNIALAFARHPLFCAIDGDSVLERDTLMRLALPFYHDRTRLATGGVVRPANGCVVRGGIVVSSRLPHSHLARFQEVEYLRAMLAGRMGWSYFDSLFIVSGALGLFSREAVMSAGAYRTDTLGEDMELVMRLQRWAGRRGMKRAIQFVSPAVAWTAVPENLGTLSRQRARWHQGLAESLWFNRSMLFQDRFSFAQGLAFVSQLLVELLGPVIELAGFVIFLALVFSGNANSTFAVLYLGIFVAGGTFTSLLGITLETIVCPRYQRTRDFAGLIIYALLENFGYRQLTAAWRVMGLWRAITRDHSWGEAVKRGHRSTDEADSERLAA